MGNTLGCLALVLAAAGPAASRDAKPEITYQFRMVEVRGLSWRAPEQTALTPVAHHGAVSVWTAPGDFIESLPPEARGFVTTDAVGRAAALAPSHLTTRKEQKFVTRVSWKGKGKTPKQTTESIREGVVATVIGRKLDQGVLVQLVIDDTDIRSVHTIDVPDPHKVAKADDPSCGTSVEVTASMDPEASSCKFDEVDLATLTESDACTQPCPMTSGQLKAACRSESSQSGWSPRKAEAVAAKAKTDERLSRAGMKPSTTGAQIQLPEIGRASAAGEWLIPEDGVLVIGFGPHTVADADGKAVVREHLAVVTAEVGEAESSETETPAPPPVAMPSEPAQATTPAPAVDSVPRTAAAIPSLPSRTLPQGVHADGTPSVLPPLPEDEQEAAPADDSKSDEPLPSPQSKRKATPAETAPSPLPLPRLPIPGGQSNATTKKIDHKAAKAMFSLPQLTQQFKPANLLPFPLPGAQFLLPLKAFGVKLPFNQKLEFELLGRIVPDLDAAAEEQVVAVGR